MNLYLWSSEALANYESGDIIVMAESVDDARRLAKQAARKEWGDPIWGNRVKEIAADLEKEPKVVRSQVVFIGGSA